MESLIDKKALASKFEEKILEISDLNLKIKIRNNLKHSITFRTIKDSIITTDAIHFKSFYSKTGKIEWGVSIRDYVYDPSHVILEPGTDQIFYLPLCSNCSGVDSIKVHFAGSKFCEECENIKIPISLIELMDRQNPVCVAMKEIR